MNPQLIGVPPVAGSGNPTAPARFPGDGLPPGPGVQWIRTDDESRLQRSKEQFDQKPRALPWAGMNDAVGVRPGRMRGGTVNHKAGSETGEDIWGWAGMNEGVGVGTGGMEFSDQP